MLSDDKKPARALLIPSLGTPRRNSRIRRLENAQRKRKKRRRLKKEISHKESPKSAKLQIKGKQKVETNVSKSYPKSSSDVAKELKKKQPINLAAKN
jgi:hypothetical protein